ncbi:uncharacterized protein LOC112906345 [Agrilus planipennis]|uniref:Uncharacterized protein LOC112906345 n=1 Tax=Agrilus planipennis TaxID=224129 RepID=A0A7F5RJC1_AGRPL|nr:uncharacterized protein LOC112906345 [Agrilus planipennis]
MDVKAKKELIKVRKAVKRKLQMLKESMVGQNLLLQQAYQPITKSLLHLKSELGEEIKKELKPEVVNWSKVDIPASSTPIKIRKLDPSNAPATILQGPPSFLREESVYEVDPRRDDSEFEQLKKAYIDYINSSRFGEYLEEFDPLPRDYIEGIIKDYEGDRFNTDVVNPRLDKVRYEWDTNKFFIGDSEIDFDGSDVVIDGKFKYTGTVGLYEQLFKLSSEYPTSIKERRDYADILKRTGAVYNLRQQTTKPSKGGGLSLLTYNEKPIEYKYFDDVNELCDRLKLLVASQQAGNTNHENEMQSILEELRESNIIE